MSSLNPSRVMCSISSVRFLPVSQALFSTRPVLVWFSTLALLISVSTLEARHEGKAPFVRVSVHTQYVLSPSSPTSLRTCFPIIWLMSSLALPFHVPCARLLQAMPRSQRHHKSLARCSTCSPEVLQAVKLARSGFFASFEPVARPEKTWLYFPQPQVILNPWIQGFNCVSSSSFSMCLAGCNSSLRNVSLLQEICSRALGTASIAKHATTAYGSTVTECRQYVVGGGGKEHEIFVLYIHFVIYSFFAAE